MILANAKIEWVLQPTAILKYVSHRQSHMTTVKCEHRLSYSHFKVSITFQFTHWIIQLTAVTQLVAVWFSGKEVGNISKVTLRQGRFVT